MKAYVLIQREPDLGPLAETLRAIRGVVSAEDVSGAYDAVALVRSDTERGLMDGILAEIKSLPGVTRALPAPLLHGSMDGSEAGRLRLEPGARGEPREAELVPAG
jgi:hypothetical protein